MVNDLVESKEGAVKKPKRYKKLKIEALGKEALKLVLDSVKKGRSNRSIAEVLSETYGKKVNHHDVANVLNENAVIMKEFKNQLSAERLDRANMVLNEVTELTEQMEGLKEANLEIRERMKRVSSNKDYAGMVKALTDLARTSSDIIKNFKKLSGQYKESPSIVIDQSTKSVNITTDQAKADRLSRELAKASFKSDIKKEEEPKKQEKVVEADFKEDDEIDKVEKDENTPNDM